MATNWLRSRVGRLVQMLERAAPGRTAHPRRPGPDRPTYGHSAFKPGTMGRVMAPDTRFAPVENEAPETLTPDQIAQFNALGFLKGIRIFPKEQAETQRAYFDSLLEKIKAAHDGRDHHSLTSYHTTCKGLWELAITPAIVGIAKDLLGPDVVCSMTHYFVKMPGEDKKVPWHQDLQYMPFDRAGSITVWLAIDPIRPHNGVLKYLPSSHLRGPLTYDDRQPESQPKGTQQPVDVLLESGEISLHSDLLVHGSGPNTSDRRRCAIALRYTPVAIRATHDWNKESIIVSGRDPSGHWADLPCPGGDDPVIRDWQRQ